MSNQSNNERKIYIINAIKNLQQCQSEEMMLEEIFRLKEKQDVLFAELACVDNPKLKGRTCPLCKETFDGYGNNPAPLRVKGQVCDRCNATQVIPARMRQ